jgi:DnaJ-class molecular chaperone
MKEWFKCDCGWYGTAPEMIEHKNPEEFWGAKVWRIEYEPACPDCGDTSIREANHPCTNHEDAESVSGHDHCAQCVQYLLAADAEDSERCPQCLGTGEHWKSFCSGCMGFGRVSHDRYQKLWDHLIEL